MAERAKKLSQEELVTIQKIVSPEPERDENGDYVENKAGNIKLAIPSQEDVDKFNNVLSKRNVNVGLVIQLVGMFVNNLQAFTTSNFQGTMDSIEIQKRIINALADRLDVDITEIEEEVIGNFQKEKQEEYLKSKLEQAADEAKEDK